MARQFKEAAPETPVVFTVHELKRLARNAAELMTLFPEAVPGGDDVPAARKVARRLRDRPLLGRRPNPGA
uniref:Uncharacterized protein n=1 Tax=Streptomyces sp. NBC_00008 TaxID=2903610 RepID=A0AAU2VT16_9ACTN